LNFLKGHKLQSLKDKNAVVTGGSKGIGKSVCLALANAGANIFILDINKEEGLKTVEELLKLNVEAYFFSINVSEENEWIDFVTSLKVKNKSIDILVNNAGIWLGKEINNVTFEEYQKLISINLTGVFLGIKHLTPSLIEAGEKTKFGSSVINLSSVAGLVGSQLDPLYSMTKGGITTFTKSMAIYFGKKKYPIRINQVHPGIIETDMGKQVAEARINQNPKMTKEESYSSGIMQTPLGRLGTVQEVANTILFLSSDESSFMTGSSLVVDGGLTAQ
jgi:NAD(P)-dependent dehydrogenase (short-subunit alcohol dehydrogenase family)